MYTGIGRAAVPVLISEIAYDIFAELFPHINHNMLHLQSRRQFTGTFNEVRFGVSIGKLPRKIPYAHRHTNDLIATVAKQ